MPEGHTIHRLARDHNRLLVGHEVHASSPQGRFADGAAVLDGRTLERTEAYGKHLFHRYGDLWLHVHLGLYGKFTTGALPAPEPRGALRLRLTADGHYVDLRGPTACELMIPPEVAAVRARLGPDPLRRDADPERAWDRLSRSRVAIAALLMDQSVIAGIGNVYRAEILYRHRIEPHLPGRGAAAGDVGGAVGRSGAADARRRAGRADRHHPPGGPAARTGHPGHRALRLPPDRAAVPHRRHRDPHRADRQPQPLLVPHLPGVTDGGHVPGLTARTYARLVATSTSG